MYYLPWDTCLRKLDNIEPWLFNPPSVEKGCLLSSGIDSAEHFSAGNREGDLPCCLITIAIILLIVWDSDSWNQLWFLGMDEGTSQL